MRSLLSYCLALYLALGILKAQYAELGIPFSLQKTVTLRQARSAQALDTLLLPKPDLLQLKAMQQSSRVGEFRVLQFAIPIDVDYSPDTHGKWSVDNEGRQQWLLSLKSEKAYSLGLYFDRFYLPKGAKLYLHGAEGIVKGAYTEQNNSTSGVFSTAHVKGEVITIELNLPKGIHRNEVRLHISQGQYGFKDIFGGNKPTQTYNKYNPIGEPFYDVYGTGLEKLSCCPNIVAYPEYKAQARSVLLMVMEGRTMGTGVLINNTKNDGTAYVLTAAHNINRVYNLKFESPTDEWQQVQAICHTIVFFFGFESPSTDQNIRGSLELSLSGAELVAYNTDADMALLKITGLPKGQDGIAYIPNYYNAYFSGWNISLEPRGAFFGIHHALASTKRYSLTADKELTLKDYHVARQEWEQKHWDIKRWEIGTTEAGASGSPLFDSRGLIIGGLSGGRSSCSSPNGDSYFAIAKTWDNGEQTRSLKPWLDPINSGFTTLQGYDSQSIPLTRLSRYYGKATVQEDWFSYEKDERISGLGQLIYLSSGIRPLGAFVLLGLSEYIKANNPELIIELSPVYNNRVDPTPLWSTTLTHYHYTAYNNQMKRMGIARRTVGLDEVELFVPGSSWIDLPAGDYLLGVRTADDSPLDFPILTHQKRLTEDFFATELWLKIKGQNWQIQKDGRTNLWVDLLVQGKAELKPRQIDEEVEDNSYPFYYHRDKVYVQNRGGEAILQIYSLEGFLYLEKTLTEGENQVDVTHIPSGYAYILSIKGDLGRCSYKILK